MKKHASFFHEPVRFIPGILLSLGLAIPSWIAGQYSRFFLG